MAIFIPQLVTRFRQAAQKFFCSPEAESASLELGAEIHSSWDGRLYRGGIGKRNSYSGTDFAKEMKYKVAGLPSAFVKDEDHGQCLLYDSMVFLVDDLRIVGIQYLFHDRCIFVQEVPPLIISPDTSTTITLNLPGYGRLPFTIT